MGGELVMYMEGWLSLKFLNDTILIKEDCEDTLLNCKAKKLNSEELKIKSASLKLLLKEIMVKTNSSLQILTWHKHTKKILPFYMIFTGSDNTEEVTQFSHFFFVYAFLVNQKQKWLNPF